MIPWIQDFFCGKLKEFFMGFHGTSDWDLVKRIIRDEGLVVCDTPWYFIFFIVISFKCAMFSCGDLKEL